MSYSLNKGSATIHPAHELRVMRLHREGRSVDFIADYLNLKRPVVRELILSNGGHLLDHETGVKGKRKNLPHAGTYQRDDTFTVTAGEVAQLMQQWRRA